MRLKLKLKKNCLLGRLKVPITVKSAAFKVNSIDLSIPWASFVLRNDAYYVGFSRCIHFFNLLSFGLLFTGL